MPLSSMDHDLIEKYLMGTLDEVSKRQVEDRLSDTEFSSFLREQESILASIQDVGRKELKCTLQQYEQANYSKESNTQPNIISMTSKWKVAASIIILIGVVSLLWISQSSDSVSYQDYYKPYPNLVDPLTKGEVGDSPSPYQLYELGKYEEATTALSGSTDQQSWYRAQCFIALGQDRSAQELLSLIIQQSDHPYHDAAQWYQALLYLKENNRSQAKLLFTEIADNEAHPYQKVSQEILKKLN